ncbi:MAG: pyridoxamine 5'-phosphate oxidase family protein [Acidobacteriaceae bacterium]
MQEVYSNSEADRGISQPVDDRGIVRTESLTLGQQKRIAEADTFFIASFHSEIGTDASHRGGNPGFVEVVDKNTLVFPNYWGNTMFNTLGNITENPHAGLLFIDFATGSTLQITGKAYVIWDKARISRFPGGNQAVEYHVSQAIETPHAIPLRWKFLAYSGANPAAPVVSQPVSSGEIHKERSIA